MRLCKTPGVIGLMSATFINCYDAWRSLCHKNKPTSTFHPEIKVVSVIHTALSKVLNAKETVSATNSRQATGVITWTIEVDGCRWIKEVPDVVVREVDAERTAAISVLLLLEQSHHLEHDIRLEPIEL